MSQLFTELSKEVGWDERPDLKYPTTAMVREALYRKNRMDIKNLIMWNRCLKSPETPRETKIINLISEGLRTMTL